MATLTEIEAAMVNKLKKYFDSQINSSLQGLNQAIPDFTGDDVHKTIIVSAFKDLKIDQEYEAAITAQARTLLYNAIEALPLETKQTLGIDHLF